MDWEQIEKFLGRKIPSFKPDQANLLLPDTSWVESYVQDVMKRAMPTGKSTNSFNYPSEVFETHQSVIVKVMIPANKDPNDIQVFIKSNQVKLEGISSDGKKAMIIKLPALIVPKTGSVRFKQGILQINMRKKSNKEQYHEAYVRF